MPTKTWFLPPDFTFLPDGAIALGRVIPDPRRPTVTLASLPEEHPTIPLPPATSIVETRAFEANTDHSFGGELLAKFLELASANGNTDVSWHHNTSFSAVEHDVRTFNGPFPAASLQAVVQIPAVKKHMDSGVFGKRSVYIISGIRVAKETITVTDERRSKISGGLGGSGPVPAGTVPVEVGGNLSVGKENSSKVTTKTAPGIVFAYRLHVIRPKRDNVEGELFSDREAFFSGEADAGKDDEELELVAVDGEVVRMDLDVEQGTFQEYKLLEGNDESYVIATG
jgi:hypothetical protein